MYLEKIDGRPIDVTWWCERCGGEIKNGKKKKTNEK
jgi:hypothetical protein